MRKYILNNKEELINIISKLPSILCSARDKQLVPNGVFIEEVLPFKVSHILPVGDFLSGVTFFSVINLLQYSFMRSDIVGTRMHEVKNRFEHTHYFFNIPVYNKNQVVYVTNPQEVKEKDDSFLPLISQDEIAGYFANRYSDLINSLLLTKFLTSSFFLSEIQPFLPLLPFTIKTDIFFENIKKFIEFFQEINIDLLQEKFWYDTEKIFDLKGKTDIFREILYNFLSQKIKYVDKKFSEVFEIIKNQLMLVYKIKLDEILDENFILKSDLVYSEKCIVKANVERLNCDFYYKDSIELEKKEPVLREITLKGERYELYGDPFQFYMHEVLKLKQKGLNSVLGLKIKEFFLKNIQLSENLFKKCTIDFLKDLKEKCTVINEQTCYEGLPIFFAISSYEVLSIKRHCRHKSVLKFYIAYIYKLEVEEVKVRKSLPKAEVVVQY